MNGTPAKKTIMLVNGHSILREKLTTMLNETPDLGVCGEAETALEAIDLCSTLRPDAALINITVDGNEGLEAIQKISAKCPALRILASVPYDEELIQEEALECGAQACIDSSNVVGSIRRALRTKGEHGAAGPHGITEAYGLFMKDFFTAR